MELLLVQYGGQKNAWIDSNIFHTWFHNTFNPHVREKLTAAGCDCEAALMDNFSVTPEVHCMQ